jgi:DNA-binding LytR/AlgR family response regulator
LVGLARSALIGLFFEHKRKRLVLFVIPQQIILPDTTINVLIANRRASDYDSIIKLLERYDEKIHILGRTTSNKQLKQFLEERKDIDVALLATRLNDGPVFEVLSKTQINQPVILTSSSEKDAFQAFKSNATDYLLEPLKYSDLSASMSKAIAKLPRWNEAVTQAVGKKRRFLLKVGDKLKSINVENISCFYAEGKTVYAVSQIDSRKYIVEYTLDELQKLYLDPYDFYRINRKFIVNINAVEEVRPYANSRLKLLTSPRVDLDMIVSREKVFDFKQWLNL